MALSIPLPEKSKVVFYDCGRPLDDAVFLDDSLEKYREKVGLFARILIGKDLSSSFPDGTREIHDIRIFDRYSYKDGCLTMSGYKGQIIREVGYSDALSNYRDSLANQGFKIEEFAYFDPEGFLVLKLKREDGATVMGNMPPQYVTLSIEKSPDGKEKNLERILKIEDNIVLSNQANVYDKGRLN